MNITPLRPSAETRKTGSQKQIGRVSLVGAGPGAADLLTVKALRTIQSADLIVYDRLVSDEICALFPAKAQCLYVGKENNHHSVCQADINQLLIDNAEQGLDVCRLKGGDAFVFGRGGEEMLALKRRGIRVEVVPGITAAAGCTSYAGIPLTHRGIAQGCTFVTGHGEKELDINWQSLAVSGLTLVFYMGLSRAGFISEQLIQAGLDAKTPAALIERGCHLEQRLITGPLDDLAAMVERESVQSPALIVVGDVVSLATDLSWFNHEQPNQDQPVLARLAISNA